MARMSRRLAPSRSDVDYPGIRTTVTPVSEGLLQGLGYKGTLSDRPALYFPFGDHLHSGPPRASLLVDECMVYVTARRGHWLLLEDSPLEFQWVLIREYLPLEARP